jgi:hypothetical protein
MSKLISWNEWIGSRYYSNNQVYKSNQINLLKNSNSKICLICRGGKLLCGKIRCPVIAKAEALLKFKTTFDNQSIQGATPPAVFVGRIGYPKINIGPMIPPFFGDTEILDTPELWMGKKIEDILDYRFSLIRGKSRSNIFEAQNPGKLLGELQELAMGKQPVDTEAIFKKKPNRILALNEYSQPFGPSAPLKKFKTTNVSVDSRIEKNFNDTDMTASDSICSLYNAGVLITRIQRTFSLGMFGLSKRRKLVPTRWGITAVDSTLSKRLVKEIKQFPTIDEYQVFTFTNIGNIYAAIFIPERWSFEWIEAWYPKTFWNLLGKSPELMGDFEPYEGRSPYASVGGCYYSARLALAEKLKKDRRQATGLILREIHPEYILPVGVWNVRESIRELLKTKPMKFDTFHKAMSHVLKNLTIPVNDWAGNSKIMRDTLFQKKISQYLHRSKNEIS